MEEKNSTISRQLMKLGLLLATLLTARIAAAGILPTPSHITHREGVFVLDSATTITFDPRLGQLAAYLGERLGLPYDAARSSDRALVLRLDEGYAPEAYVLRILPSRIEIEAGDTGGVFNGMQSLFQLLPPEVYARTPDYPVRLGCCEIADAPRYAYRGMHLDVARTWIGPEAVKRFIDGLACHKINKLHLHLSDDEGWRIEIRSHPELAAVGGFRGGDSPVRPVYGKWDEKYGGYFTQEELRELADYAALRNIEIIPEIDLPGHSRNIARVRPEILCRYTPDTSASNGYDERSAWCVAREENYALLEDILGEVCALFPSPYIHIGGDEVEASQWKRCPDCRALMRRLGTDDPHRLEEYFMERTAAILARHGKLPAVWNEAVRTGTLPRTTRVHGWESTKAVRESLAAGYPTVVMPAQSFYFDMRQTPHEEGHSWAAVFDAKETYEYTLPEGLTADERRRILGFQGAFWTEAYVSHEPERPDYLDFMCYPRICALAEQAWHGNAEGWEAFSETLREEHYDRLTAMDIRFRLFPPVVQYGEGALTATAPDTEAELYYRLEGDTVEHRYTRPIRTDTPHRYLFRARQGTGRSAEVGAAAYYRTIAPALTLATSMGESRRIPYANVEKYRGVARTARACRQGDWIRYDFAEPVRCREVFLQTGHLQVPKTIVTTGYAEISYDGTHFERAGELEKGSVTLHPARPLRSVRIVSTCDDNGCAFVTIQPPRIKPVL